MENIGAGIGIKHGLLYIINVLLNKVSHIFHLYLNEYKNRR